MTLAPGVLRDSSGVTGWLGSLQGRGGAVSAWQTLSSSAYALAPFAVIP